MAGDAASDSPAKPTADAAAARTRDLATTHACDVLVIGGGPAASTAARLLAQWGRDVLMVVKATGGEFDLPESLTPSCGKLFDLMGIRADIDQAEFVRSTGHTVWWGAQPERSELFGDGLTGWQVTSRRLSAVMRQCAVDAGARLTHRALVADDAVGWPARFVLDCSGRAGVLARPLGARHYEPGQRTVALLGVWEHDAWPEPSSTHTWLESYRDGWAWSVPLDTRRRSVAVMVDPSTTMLTRGEGAERTYREEVQKAPHLSMLLEHAELAAGPSGCDASVYCAGRMTGDNWMLVGDACSTIDPLSSAGVRKAMASGWLAAVAVNSALTDSRLTAPAMGLYETREVEVYRQFLELTRRFMVEGGSGAEPHPFWSDRGNPAPGASPGDQAAVATAHERLRTAARVVLQVGPDVRLEQRPALGERLVRLEEQVVTPTRAEGVRWVEGVDVVALLDCAPHADQVPDLYERYSREVGPVGLPAFLTALSTAVARRWLILS